MGFWQTGYAEFHEPDGIGDNFFQGPPEYRCAICAKVFPSSDALQDHRFDVHPYQRPVLMIRGMELGNAPFRITRQLATVDVVPLRYAAIELNGQPVGLGELRRQLTRIKHDKATVTLFNDGVSAKFTLDIELATPSDLSGIEKSFLQLTRRRLLNQRVLEDFIDNARSYPTAMSYCDGICEYFYGILAKEQRPDSRLRYSEYVDKFGRAADCLKDFQRPLADSIRGIIAFHYNHFEDCLRLCPRTRVGAAAARYKHWLDGDMSKAEGAIGAVPDARLETLLTDAQTDQIIVWSVSSLKKSSAERGYIEGLSRRDIADTDRAKLHILLAELALSEHDPARARHHANELRNRPLLDTWAERVLASTKQQGN